MVLSIKTSDTLENTKNSLKSNILPVLIAMCGIQADVCDNLHAIFIF